MRKLGTVPKLVALLALGAIPAVAASSVAAPGIGAVGAWYLALDAEPFGLPPGTTLPGLATFQLGGTFQIVDGGDFGGAPFFTKDSAQIGTWRRGPGGRIEAKGLFLQADAEDGEVKAWNRVELVLYPHGRDRLRGYVNVYALPCDLPAPFGVFGCPDPIASAGSFVPNSPPNVPVELTRLSVR
jgi:hypothetical protein